MYTVEIWMKGNEVEEDERDFQIKTSEVLPKVSSRPWVGGGAIDYCPCYGQIAFYSLITFSYQPQQGLHTQATNTLSHKHTVKSLGDSYRHSKTEEVKCIFGFQAVWNQLLGASAQHIFNIFPFSSMAICTSFLTRNLFQASEKVRQCYCCLEKVVQRHEAQLDIVGRYTGCFLFPPPLKTFKQKNW